MSGAARTLPGLVAEVEVWRDPWGIPHIRASRAEDAFFGLGYVHATDRLWQMDANRRRAIGRFAEWAGPAALPFDLLARRLGGEAASRRDAVALGAEARAMLHAYAAGVNAFIAQGALPAEYALLGEAPEPWQDWHAIAAMRHASLMLNSVYPKLWRALALPVVGPHQLGKLRMDGGGEEMVCMPPGAVTQREGPPLDALAGAMAELLRTASPDAAGGGSNNWVLAGSRTASGRPLLAGDPHRMLDMPNLYCQCHLACDSASDGFDVIGLTVPGVPGFPHFAHNRDVAWGVTVAFVDTADLFIERFADGGQRYLEREGEWRETARRVEQVGVRGQPAVACEIVETSRGPVVTGDPASGSALALRTMSHAELDRSFECMLPMMRARSVDALHAATRGWGLIDHNLVAADTAGHIGHLVRALVPRRPAANGWLPVPGWRAEHAWDGHVAWDRMPRQVDPPGGLIVTANNRVAAAGEDYLCTDCHPPHRAERIWQRLQALGPATIDDMAAIHRDTLSPPARELCARLGGIDGLTPAAAALRDRLLAWDGFMQAGSTEAAAYTSLRLKLARAVAARSGLGAVGMAAQDGLPPGIAPENHLWWCLPHLLRQDDAGLLGGAAWPELLREALEAAAAEPPATWGERHRMTRRHLLAAQFPQAPALAARDAGPLMGDSDTVFCSGYVPSLGTEPVYASLSRYVFDVGGWDNSRWIVFHGAAADPDSPWHDNQAAAWAAGEMVPMLYDWEAVARQGVLQEMLRPGVQAPD